MLKRILVLHPVSIQEKKNFLHPVLHMSRKHYYSANQTKDDKERSV